MKPRDECIYYLIREMGGLGAKAKSVYFDDMLKHIRRHGLVEMSPLEINAVVYAARQRDRMAELNDAVGEEPLGRGDVMSTKLYRLRMGIERARRQMHKAHEAGNPEQLMATSQRLDCLLNEYERAKKEAGLHYAG